MVCLLKTAAVLLPSSLFFFFLTRARHDLVQLGLIEQLGVAGPLPFLWVGVL